MYTDMVGYTALTQSNEAQAMQVLERHNRLLRPFFPRFHGREVKAIGDSFLVEFESALDALNCASEIQSYLHDYNVSSKEEWKVKLRIGIHLGDVIHQGGDVFGDAVNIASRIYPIAGPEGICVSQQIYDQVQNKFDLPLLSLGEKTLKNVSRPVQVYSVQMSWEQPASREVTPYPANRIAILPFTSFSSNPDDAYFADGVTDEIISAVAGISGLSVISRTSVVGYKGTTKKVEEIGKELKVGSILEGTFKKAGNKIRVTTQLINVAEDKHLWAQNYDRNLDDIFEVQSDVAKQVAEALRVRILSPEKERIERKPTENTSAYTLYLKGSNLVRSKFSGSTGQQAESLKSALKCFEQAVAEDARFALGYVGQAECCALLLREYGAEREAGLKKAKELLDRAFELDPELAEAHATRGLILEAEYRPQDEESELKKAIALKPSYASAHNTYYILLTAELRWEEALEQIERALELDPLSPIYNGNLGWFYFRRREYSRALELYRRAIELGLLSAGHFWVASIHGRMKEFTSMKREFADFVKLEQTSSPFARTTADFYTAYYENDRQTCRNLLPELEAHAGKVKWLDASGVALAYFGLGENDKGFEWLERSYSRREASLMQVKLRPELDGVRDDPRYLDLLKRLGLD
jgi:TolB-like protein